MYQGSLVAQLLLDMLILLVCTGPLNLGAFWGCFYVDPTTLKPTFKNYYPGSITPPSSKDIEAFVYDSPMQMFEIQSAATGASSQADIFSTCDLASNGGRTRDGCINRWNLQTVLEQVQHQLKVIGVSRDPANDEIGAANVNWRVQICEHLFGSGTAGAA